MHSWLTARAFILLYYSLSKCETWGRSLTADSPFLICKDDVPHDLPAAPARSTACARPTMRACGPSWAKSETNRSGTANGRLGT